MLACIYIINPVSISVASPLFVLGIKGEKRDVITWIGSLSVGVGVGGMRGQPKQKTVGREWCAQWLKRWNILTWLYRYFITSP